MNLKYRVEQSSGPGIRDIIDILVFEATDFGAGPILTALSNTIEKVSDKEYNLHIPPEMVYCYDDSVDECMLRNTIKIMIATMGIYTRKNIEYGLWLVDTKKMARKLYGKSSNAVDCYDVSDAVEVFNIGGNVGTLYGFEKCPEPIQPDHIEILKSEFKLI